MSFFDPGMEWRDSRLTRSLLYESESETENEDEGGERQIRKQAGLTFPSPLKLFHKVFSFLFSPNFALNLSRQLSNRQ
jgi:hypothetical protein